MTPNITSKGGDTLRVAFLVRSFPVVSETFILRQITGLMDLGHEVDIFALCKPEDNAPAHKEVIQYDLLARTTYLDEPADACYWEMPVRPVFGETWVPGATEPIKNWRRVANALPKFLQCALKTPGITRKVLSKAEYGHQAASLSALHRLAKFCSVTKRYDLLHAHFGPVGKTLRFARALLHAPLIVTFHGYDFSTVPRQEGKNVYDSLFRETDAVTVNCEYARERVIELGCPPERIHTLHVGINVNDFTFQDRARRSDDPIRLLTIGRLVEKKGIEFAIRAVASVREKYPKLHYDIIGDGPLRPVLEKLVTDLALEKNVTLHGAKESQFVREQMSKAHIFLLPSVTAETGDQEGTPVSLMEAQASGLPILSTRHSGIPEVVLDGESGFLLAERDVSSLAEKLCFLVENPEICGQMGSRGRKHVETQFDLQQLNRDLVGIYERTLKQFHRAT